MTNYDFKQGYTSFPDLMFQKAMKELKPSEFSIYTMIGRLTTGEGKEKALITVEDLRNRTLYSVGTIRKALNSLVKKGFILKEKGGIYSLAVGGKQ